MSGHHVADGEVWTIDTGLTHRRDPFSLGELVIIAPGNRGMCEMVDCKACLHSRAVELLIRYGDDLASDTEQF